MPHASSATYAGFWLRAVASIIDGILIQAALWILGAGASMGGFGMGAPGMMGSTRGGVGILAGLLYYVLMESSEKQATLGKMALGIKVTDLDGKRVTIGRAAGRYFAKYVSAIILGIGFLMAAFTQKKQALHDMIAGTLVVRG